MIKSHRNRNTQGSLAGCRAFDASVKNAVFSESDFYLILIRSMIGSKKQKADVF